MILKAIHGRHVRIYDARQVVSVDRFKCSFDVFNRRKKLDRVRLVDLASIDDGEKQAFDGVVRLFCDELSVSPGDVLVELQRRRSVDADDDDRDEEKIAEEEEEGKGVAADHRLGGVLCVARRNAWGGKERFVVEAHRKSFDRDLPVGHVAFLDVDRISHESTPVEPVNPAFEGHVDVIHVLVRRRRADSR